MHCPNERHCHFILRCLYYRAPENTLLHNPNGPLRRPQAKVDRPGLWTHATEGRAHDPRDDELCHLICSSGGVEFGGCDKDEGDEHVGGARRGNTILWAIDCALKVVRSEGLMALYKGFIPTISRQGPSTVVLFVTLEQIRKIFKKF